MSGEFAWVDENQGVTGLKTEAECKLNGERRQDLLPGRRCGESS